MRLWQVKQNNPNVADTIVVDNLAADETNSFLKELSGACTSAGLTVSNTAGAAPAEVFTQLSQALSIYGGGGAAYHADSGAVNAYVLTIVAPKQTPLAYFLGQTIMFIPGTPNTGASTVNVNGIGVVAIVDINGNALVGGEIYGFCTLMYDSVAVKFKVVSSSSGGKGIKASGSFNASTGTAVEDTASYENITSVTRTASGRYTVALTNNMADAFYIVTANGSRDDPLAASGTQSVVPHTRLVGSFKLTSTISDAYADFDYVNFTVYGILA